MDNVLCANSSHQATNILSAMIYCIAQLLTKQNIRRRHFIDKFNVVNIDRQHLRPPVLAILLKTIEREIMTDNYVV